MQQVRTPKKWTVARAWFILFRETLDYIGMRKRGLDDERYSLTPSAKLSTYGVSEKVPYAADKNSNVW